MPTIVDSIIVKFGLDSSGVTTGSKTVNEQLKKTKDEAAKVGKDFEASGKRASAFFSQIRNQALLLFATLTGARGLKDFVSNVTNSDAALGRMAKIIGTTTQELSKWRGIATATGGSADGVASSINGLNQSLVKLSLTGESEIIPYFRALQAFAPQVGLTLEGANGQMKTAIEMLPQLHAAVQGMEAAKATAILSGMGLGQDLINILMASDKEFNQFMSDQKKWGLVTEKQAAAAQKLQYSTAGVIQSFTSLGRVIVYKMAPELEKMNQRLIDMAAWFEKNPKAMEWALLGIIGVMTTLAVTIGGPIAAVAALATAIAILYADWEQYNATGTSTFEDFWKSIDAGWTKITTGTTNAAKSFQKWVAEVTGFDPSTFTTGLNEVDSAINNTDEQINADFDKWISEWAQKWNNFWSDDVVKAILESGPAIFHAVKKTFGDAFDWAIKSANTVWRALTGKDLIGGENEKDAADKAAANIAGGAAGGGSLGNAADRKQQEEDIQYMMKKGWSRENAAALVAQGLAESQDNPQSRERLANGQLGPGEGIFQWTSPERKANFKRVIGKDILSASRQEQYDFADWELRNSHKAAGDALRAQSTATGSSDVLMNQFEMPAERVKNGRVRRGLATNLMAPPPVIPPAGGGAAAVAAASIASTSSAPAGNKTDISIGQINVHTQATDAAGISDTIKGALDDRFNSSQANYGQM